MAKPKITKTETPKAPKTKITRVDTNKWMGSSPLSGSGQSWSEWGKSNPNLNTLGSCFCQQFSI